MGILEGITAFLQLANKGMDAWAKFQITRAQAAEVDLHARIHELRQSNGNTATEEEQDEFLKKLGKLGSSL